MDTNQTESVSYEIQHLQQNFGALMEVTEAYSLAPRGYSKLPNNRAARLSILGIKENKRSATFQPVIIDG